MTSSYLFHSDGLKTLARYVAADTLLAFDLDGTLAPIVENYSAAKVDEPVRATMERLVKLAKVAVITGRSRKDALAVLGFEPHLLVGNHGAEWPDEEAGRNWHQIKLCLKWREQLYEILNQVQGIEIEFKGESVSIHYRKSGDQVQALSHINAAIEILEPSPQKFGGKFVVNLLPPEAITKGDALVAAMEMFGLKRAIFIGDDVTDEDVFQLCNVDIFGIHVGKDDQTAAPYYINNESEMLGVLDSMVGTLKLHGKKEIPCNSGTV